MQHILKRIISILGYIMQSGKVENQLNLALSVSEEQRIKSIDLAVGYMPVSKTWELVVRYAGNLNRIRDELQISVTELSDQYAILIIPEYLIDRLTEYEEIIFIEKPKLLFYEVNQGKTASCINPLQSQNYNLFGKGVLIGILDSGIDYSHPDFINEDGTTRIVALWDQTIAGSPPKGFNIGTLYTKEEINEALKIPMPQRMNIVPSTDLSGHGTHIAGIAAGNGRASRGLNRGIASKSDLIIVKLGVSIGNSFPSTVQLMQGIEFVTNIAMELGMPIAVNISNGNNYGSHTGAALLETYIDDTVSRWKSNIMIGTGNEGTSGNHAQGVLTMGVNTNIEIAVSSYEFSINIQIWKNYYDHFDIIIVHPNGTRVGPIPQILGKQQFIIAQTEILLYYGDPTPYNIQQEIYIELIPTGNYVNSGLWHIELVPRKIVTGIYDMWLPAGRAKNPETRFLLSSEFTTLTDRKSVV